MARLVREWRKILTTEDAGDTWGNALDLQAVKIFARPLRFAAGAHLPPRLFARLLRIASGDLLVPGGVEGPSPGFADGAANHGPECARLADRALVDVDENSAKHHDRGDIVYDIADGDGDCAERSRARPQDGSRDDVENAAANDLPEQKFLTGVEK